MQKIPSKIQELINDPKAIFISNHSGGKDSQSMYLLLKHLIPAERLIVIHAHLPEVEWDGTIEFIEKTVDPKNEIFVVQAKKTFFEMVEKRGMFPSPSYRQCTSDLKRDPISKKIRQICNDRGFTTVINCMGLRAEESPARSKKETFKINKRETNSKRNWFEWLPVHELSTKQIFASIKIENQEAFWTYSKGLSRKSCSFCIMASKSDLCIAAKLRPDLLEKYDALEKKFDNVMMMPTKKHGKRTLKEIINS
jgi:DNA sulfur modification protein DndC